MKASGSKTGWSNFDQSLLTRMIGMSHFVLHPDVRLQVDQAGIILRFHRFPNSVFQLVQLQLVSSPDLPPREALFLQLDVGRMHYEDLRF
jgi:hypothetical protein